MARKYDEEKRIRILEAATVIFGERGFNEASIKEIASDAGLSPGTVYTYFKNKEQLFRAAVDDGWSRFIHGMERLRDDGLPLEKKILWLIDTGLEVIRDLHPLLRGMYSDAARRSLVRSKLDSLIGLLEDIVLDGEAPGLFAEFERWEIRKFLLRSIVQGVFFDISTTAGENLDEEIRRLRHLLKDGMENGAYRGTDVTWE
jgi:AcrR family transcriptional regulator